MKTLLKPVPDHFSFAVKLSDQIPVTKRQILSEVTRLYDPLGWLSPTTIQLKSFIQLMWMDKISWDQTISVTLQEHYGRLRQQLKELEDIKLSRRVLLAQTTKELQLHVFCDASTTAYAAVVYMRQETSEGTTYVKMLAAKTRVAPIKYICVPGMELCAALLGSKLVEVTLAAISDKRFIIPTVFAWTDSQVTIAWLREFPRKWKTFVANRVAKIQELLPAEKWKFVPTKDNPADCASRGIPESALAY